MSEILTKPGGAHRVLLVDDTPEVLALYSAMLRFAGYQVTTSRSAAEALVVLGQQKPDLILLDYMMPVTNGPALLRRLRADACFRDIAVVLLTASDQDEHIDEAFAAGVDDYLTKPIDRRILLSRVKAAIDARNDRLNAGRAFELALERDHLLRQLEEGKALQRSQLPVLPIAWDGWAVSAALLPCNHVGGDLYDVITVQDEQRRVLVVIDVSGHGLAAAMVGSSVRSCLRLLRGHHPREIAAELNRHLHQQGDLYACVAVMAVGPNDVTIVNAGLPPIAVIEDGAITRLVSGHGTPPGMIAEAEYDFSLIERRAGIRFALMSDGVTEPFGAPDDTPAAIARLGVLGDGLPTQDALTLRLKNLFTTTPQLDDATVLMLGDAGAASRSRS